MTRHSKSKKVVATGSRRKVMNGTAKHTSHGLTKSDLVKKDGRYKSKKKQSLARVNPALKKWVAAAKAEGYLQKGSFRKMPKKGTAAYNSIRARYESM